jgi:predicted RNase H-like HicB family nuclease
LLDDPSRIEVSLKIPVQFQFELPIGVKKQGKWFISWCPVLDLYSQGETREKAVENIIEAVQLFVLSCFERGTLDEVLKQQGFRRIGSRRAPPRIPASDLPKEVKMLKVPIPFFVERRADELCPA